MAFTQDDLTNVENAIRELLRTGIVEIEVDGERSKYTSLTQLYKIRDKIKSELYSTVNNSAFIKVRMTNVD